MFKLKHCFDLNSREGTSVGVVYAGPPQPSDLRYAYTREQILSRPAALGVRDLIRERGDTSACGNTPPLWALGTHFASRGVENHQLVHVENIGQPKIPLGYHHNKRNNS